MKYSKREREDAADICMVMASNWQFGAWTEEVARSLGIRTDSVAMDLARAASDVPMPVIHVKYSPGVWPPVPEGWAEAEALIRSGWTP